ncbi:dynein regulatory complex protein 10-like [Megalops cyprinoides]|uniref:dynein regulatory complex protein 10-like n=1 Tax=Megalops cyprinoides TaxID=118141 RepID=UPI001864540A|nr:dynein regulatory complex protein 10-like [Megalops cyprinoides]
MASKEDTAKVLDDSRDEQAFFEIQRIDGVLDECIWKVETASLFPALLANLDRLSPVIGNQLVGPVREHHLLAERLATHKQEGEEGKVELAGLKEAFRSSLRLMFQHLREHPTVCKQLKREASAGQCQQLAAGLKELKALLMDKMITGPAEARERSRYVQELFFKHRKNMVVVEALEEEVDAANKDKDAMIAKKDEQIRKLKVSMHQVKQASESTLAGLREGVDKLKQSDRNVSHERRDRMQEQANQLRAQLKKLTTENRESETSLRKRKNRLETEIENWIQKYDTDIGEKQAELEELSKLYQQEQEEVQKLGQYTTRMERDYQRIMQERQLAAEQNQKEEQETADEEQNDLDVAAD